MVLEQPLIHLKIKALDGELHRLLRESSESSFVPEVPARDVMVVDNKALPAKIGLAKPEGQARLLHDLANIELQAMELGLRTLAEFPHAPKEFREELAEITRSEAAHLQLCLDGIESLGFRWGLWPVHVSLWTSVSRDQDLIERILSVHRHLEGSGLDAGESIMKRLTGVADKATRRAVSRIVEEEVGHVDFGSRWYRKICAAERKDPETEFKQRMPAIFLKAPRREPLAVNRRVAAGFTASEIDCLSQIQREHLKPHPHR